MTADESAGSANCPRDTARTKRLAYLIRLSPTTVVGFFKVTLRGRGCHGFGVILARVGGLTLSVPERRSGRCREHVVLVAAPRGTMLLSVRSRRVRTFTRSPLEDILAADGLDRLALAGNREERVCDIRQITGNGLGEVGEGLSELSDCACRSKRRW